MPVIATQTTRFLPALVPVHQKKAVTKRFLARMGKVMQNKVKKVSIRSKYAEMAKKEEKHFMNSMSKFIDITEQEQKVSTKRAKVVAKDQKKAERDAKKLENEQKKAEREAKKVENEQKKAEREAKKLENEQKKAERDTQRELKKNEMEVKKREMEAKKEAKQAEIIGQNAGVKTKKEKESKNTKNSLGKGKKPLKLVNPDQLEII